VAEQANDEAETSAAKPAPAAKPEHKRQARRGVSAPAKSKSSARPKSSGSSPRPKPDPAARAELKRRVRAEREARGKDGGESVPVAYRLQRIEDALHRQSELSEKLLRKMESLAAGPIDAEPRKGS